MSKRVFLDRGIILLHLVNKNKNGAILNLKNIYYLPSSPSNLISLAFLKDYRIYQNNNKKKLYKRYLRRTLASIKR